VVRPVGQFLFLQPAVRCLPQCSRTGERLGSAGQMLQQLLSLALIAAAKLQVLTNPFQMIKSRFFVLRVVANSAYVRGNSLFVLLWFSEWQRLDFRRACFQSLGRHIFNGLFTGEEFSDWSTTIVVMGAFDSGQLASLRSLTEVFGPMCLKLGVQDFGESVESSKPLPKSLHVAFLAGDLSSTLLVRWAADKESPSSVPTFA
jgi:hypothetical protein